MEFIIQISFFVRFCVTDFVLSCLTLFYIFCHLTLTAHFYINNMKYVNKIITYFKQYSNNKQEAPLAGKVCVSPSYLSSEYMSSRLFWMGVPVTAQRARALSWHTAMDVCTLGFLMLWASSRTTRAQATRRRGAERGG